MRVMSYSEDLVSAPPLAPVAPQSSEADAPFQRPGPDVLSETIPVVFIGRNRFGLWVARDADARFGGLFWRERAALDFARTNAAPRPCAPRDEAAFNLIHHFQTSVQVVHFERILPAIFLRKRF